MLRMWLVATLMLSERRVIITLIFAKKTEQNSYVTFKRLPVANIKSVLCTNVIRTRVSLGMLILQFNDWDV
jgi:hypothetical protein